MVNQIQEKDYVRLERTAKAMRVDFAQNRPSAVVQRKVLVRTVAVLDFDISWEKFQPRPEDKPSYKFHDNPRLWGDTNESTGRIDIYTSDASIKRGDTVAIDIVEAVHARREDKANLNDSDAGLKTETRRYFRMWKQNPISELDTVFRKYTEESWKDGTYINQVIYSAGLFSDDHQAEYTIHDKAQVMQNDALKEE